MIFHGVHISELTTESLANIFADWRTSHAQAGVLALLHESEKERVELLQTAARLHDLPLIGAIFPALLTEAGFQSSGVILLQLDPCPPWFLVEQLSEQAGSGRMAQIADFVESNAAAVAQSPDQPPTLFMLFDGMLPNVSTLLLSLFANLGESVRYAGINAGSESFQPMPSLFDKDRFFGEGCIALLIPDSLQVAVEHGYPVTKPLFQATSTSGNQIAQINGRPAMTVYGELMKSEFGLEVTPENFYQYAVHYPFGLVTALEVLVRIPVAFTEEGAICCVGEIPSNSILRLLQAPDLEQSTCVTHLAHRLNSSETPLLTFYCAGRRMHFGAQSEVEVRALKTSCKASELFGALTLGEISTNADIGMPKFHNAALVCIR